MKMPQTIFLLFVVQISFMRSYSQSAKYDVDVITDSITLDNVIEYKSMSGERLSERLKRYERLNKIAKNEDLIRLNNHTSPTVRYYAFEAICTRSDIDFFPMLLHHIYDTSYVSYIFGDVMRGQYLADLMLEIVELTSEQQKIIDSILIFEPSLKLKTKSQILTEKAYPISYYQRIKHLVTVDKNPCAVVSLSRYKKQEDKELIITFLTSADKIQKYYGVWAVRYFPDKDFFPFIKTISINEINKEEYTIDKEFIVSLFKTTMQYQDKPSRRLLIKMRNKLKRNDIPYSNYLKALLYIHPHKTYNNIYPKKEYANLEEDMKNDYFIIRRDFIK